MKLSLFGATLSVLFVGASSLAWSNAAAATTGSTCTTTSTSKVVHRGETEFDQVARSVNGFFSANRNAGPISTPYRREFTDGKTEVIRVETDVTSCGSQGAPTVSPRSIGGCSYVGCTGSPGAEFDTMPVGSVVNMSSCGGGIQRSGTYQKSSTGAWVMTAYKEERVTQCSAIS